VETPPETPGAQSAGGGGTWWLTDDPVVQSDPRPASGSSRRDFVSVLFPDLGSGGRLSGPLAPPDPSLLPGCLAVGVCDLASWRRRLNQRYVRTSPEERRRMRLTRRYDGIKDREVGGPTKEIFEARFKKKKKGEESHREFLLQGAAVQELGGVSGAPGDASGEEPPRPAGTPVEPEGRSSARPRAPDPHR